MKVSVKGLRHYFKFCIFLVVASNVFLLYSFYTPYPLKLFDLNSHYPFLSLNILEVIFTILPFVYVTSIILLFINKTLFIYYNLVITFLQILYLAKPLIKLQCPSCSLIGFIPYLGLNLQILYLTFILFIVINLGFVYKRSIM